MATSFARTWRSTANNTLDSLSANNCAKSAIWNLKALITAALSFIDSSGNPISPTAPFTHYSSSDAVTFGVDATDRWNTAGAYDVTKLVNASAGSAHSHWTGRSIANYGGVTGYLYLTLDISGSLPTHNFALSRTAPTGGSISNRPSAADELTLSFGLTEAGVTGAKAHGIVNTAGDFLFLCSKVGGGLAYGQMMLMSLLQAKSQDNWPYVWGGVGGNSTINGLLSRSSINAATPASMQCRNRDNTVSLNPMCPAWCMAGTSTPFFSQQTTTDATDSKWNDLPMKVFVNKAGYYSLKGVLPDIYWAPESAAQGQVEPIAGTPQTTVLGQSWLPMFATLTL